MPRLIVTRPAAQAADWLLQLEARGVAALALPLIDIAALPDAAPLAAAWSSLPARRLVVFVSANAVEHFFAARPAAAAWPAQLVAAAPGPGTSAALRAAGVAEASIVEPDAGAAQLDSEALWQRLRQRDWRGANVLIVRGDGGREWLADRLQEAGARVEHVASYRRLPPALSPDARRLLDAAAADPRGYVWLFSSSQAIDHLEAAAGAVRWSQARAIATHPRIAERARLAGFANVSEVSPGLDAVVACIQSMRP